MFTFNIEQIKKIFEPLRVGGERRGYRICMRDRNGVLVEAHGLTEGEATELARRIQPPESLPGFRAQKNKKTI
jgi:hypothetical protein